VKTDSAGNVQWNKTISGVPGVGSYGTYVTSIISTNDGGFSIIGTDSQSYSSKNFKTIHLDANGNATWTQLYGNQNEEFSAYVQAAVQTTDGGYLIGGYFSPEYNTAYSALLVRTDGKGNLLWYKSYETEGVLSINAIAQTADGGYFFAGFTSDFVCIVKTDAAGNLQELINLDTLWADMYDKAVSAIIPTDDGSFAFTGHYIGINGKTYDRIWFAKVSTQTGSSTIPEITPFHAFVALMIITGVMVGFKKKSARPLLYKKDVHNR